MYGRYFSVLTSSLLAAVVSCHHQVAVGAEVLDVGGLIAANSLALHPGELEHAARVVLQQVALERLPASAHTHHHVLVVQHLQGDKGVRVSLLVSTLSPCFYRSNVISLMKA